jgi:tetratricopeptide (TPR) repeat protein
MGEQRDLGTVREPTGRQRRVHRWRLGLAVVVLALGGTAVLAWPRTDPIVLLMRATSNFDMGRFERAEALLAERSRQTPPISLDWFLRARIAEARHNFDAALAFLRMIPDSDPYAGQAWLLTGQIELNRDHARTAEAALRRAVALNPDQAVAHRELAYIYAVQHRLGECDGEFRTLAGLVDLDYQRLFVWCQNGCDIWNPDEAGARLERFLRSDPDDRASRLALALSYQRAGKDELAEKLLAPLPDSDVDVRVLRAEIALDRNDVATALALTASSRDDHPSLNVLRGRLALGRHNADEAIRDFRRALLSEPGNRDALHGLGQAFRLRGDHDAAEPYLEQARRRDALKRMILDARPNSKFDHRLFYKLGTACEAIPMPLEAVTWYRLAISRDPLDSEAQKALARLTHPS